MKRFAICALCVFLLTSACYRRPDPQTDQRIRILQAQLIESDAKNGELRRIISQQKQELDDRYGACCVGGSAEDGLSTDASDDNGMRGPDL